MFSIFDKNWIYFHTKDEIWLLWLVSIKKLWTNIFSFTESHNIELHEKEGHVSPLYENFSDKHEAFWFTQPLLYCGIHMASFTKLSDLVLNVYKSNFSADNSPDLCGGVHRAKTECLFCFSLSCNSHLTVAAFCVLGFNDSSVNQFLNENIQPKKT